MGHDYLGAARVFLQVYEHRSVTAAASALFVTQPTATYSLNKMRTLFKDELFVRRSNVLVPTDLAHFLYPSLREVVEAFDNLVDKPSAFSPAESTRTFRLMMTDAGISDLLPPLAKHMAVVAPRASLEVQPLALSAIADALRMGSVDAAIASTHLHDRDLNRTILFPVHYVGVCSASHPRIGSHPTREEYLAERHVTIVGELGHGGVEEAATGEFGSDRDVVATIPSFAGLVRLLNETEYVAYAPSQIARNWLDRGFLRVFSLPFTTPVNELSIYTLKRSLPSGELTWFESILVEVCSQQDVVLDI